MVYTALTRKAMTIAYHAHHGQLDKCGAPYIFHPIHLAEQMDDEISCCVALLHDVVEDTEVTLDDLRSEFPDTVIVPVSLLTHQENEDYFTYVRRIKEDSIARKVKLADLEHNSDQSRCAGSGIPESRLTAWREKYSEAKRLLLK